MTEAGDLDRTGETRAQVRVLRMLSALSAAGVEEVGVQDFHAFAFFTEVLAPVWGLDSPTGDILKEEGGPHYPMLQSALDRLVGLGLVRVARLTGEDRGGRWRLDVAFAIRAQAAAPVIALLDDMPDENPAVVEFLEQLAFSFADIPADSDATEFDDLADRLRELWDGTPAGAKRLRALLNAVIEINRGNGDAEVDQAGPPPNVKATSRPKA